MHKIIIDPEDIQLDNPVAKDLFTPKFRHRIRIVKDRKLEAIKKKQQEEIEDVLFEDETT